VWVRRYQGAALALALDENGNVYVTGHTWGVNSPDYATIKYSPTGDTLWVRRYAGPGDKDDRASTLTVDKNGDVYVGGSSGTIKYLSNGDLAWIRTEAIGSLSLDNTGSLYIVGTLTGIGGTYDYSAIKYSPNGDTSWARSYNGPDNDEDITSALALDENGNLYVSGSSVSSKTCSDYVTIKYSPNGDVLWIKQYDDPYGFCERPTDLAVDKGGAVYVSGYSGFWEPSQYDWVTVKYFQCFAKPGDADGDSTIQISDIVTIINYLFKEQPVLNPSCRGDVNADGKVLLSDIVYLINYLFKSGPTPLKSKECCL